MSENSNISNNAGPGSAAEPSMEEILASIRRILKEDEGTRDPETDDDLLVLDASMMAPPPDISSATALPPGNGGIVPPEAPMGSYREPMHFASESRLDAQAAPEAGYRKPSQFFSNVQAPDGLVGEKAASAIASTVGTLVRSITTDRAVAVSRGGITIEDIVREEIKPVLKAWLDTHLPSLVERIVRAEIERVIDRSQL
jgi:cell pole-organizing protein PopZ